MKYYTGIGSRQTPKDILKLMEDIAFKLAQKGYILRSGAAGGADTAFEDGAKYYAEQIEERVTLAQIYIPWASFIKGGDHGDFYKDWYKVLDRMSKKEEAYRPASETHPAWDKCSVGAKALHARNTFQILGPNLNNPSSFLICWAQLDKHGQLKGGTRTAWELAKKHNVPCFNLYNEDDKQRLIKFVEG
jgi:hypothetical protein